MTTRFLRPATTADAQPALSVWRDSIIQLCVRDHHNDGPTLERWLRNKTVRQFDQMLADRDNYVIVTGEQSVICGIGQLNRGGELHLCYVRPGRERSGFGSALLRALEAQGRRWGLVDIHLRSTEGARTFYERHGYVASGAPTAAYGVLIDYPYSKRLADAPIG
jgi:GNAT superfamily N-acetyltransferase